MCFFLIYFIENCLYDTCQVAKMLESEFRVMSSGKMLQRLHSELYRVLAGLGFLSFCLPLVKPIMCYSDKLANFPPHYLASEV